MPHKFAVGQIVHFRPVAWPIDAARGLYHVTMLLPERNGEFEYRIKHPKDPERIAEESELSAMDDTPGAKSR